MSGAADLHKAINAVWDSQSLDDHFTALWEVDDITDYIVLHDTKAQPAQPFPYCVFRIDQGVTTDRMSRNNVSIWEIRQVPVEFMVHARTLSGDSRTPKEIAAALIEEITKVFGGHPTVAPTALSLDNGNHLITTYQHDYGMCEGEDEYVWTLSYIAKLDIPVTVVA